MNLKYAVLVVLIPFILLGSIIVGGELGRESFNSPIQLTLRYTGELIISTTEKYVDEVFGDLSKWCEVSVGEVYLVLKYTVDVYVELDHEAHNVALNVTFDTNSTEVLLSNHSCLVEAVENMLQEILISNNTHGFPLVLEFKRGTVSLAPIKENGTVVAMTRYGGLDIVQVKDEYSIISSIHGIYTHSKNLYYEPISRIPIHYVEIEARKDEKGSFSSTLYVTLNAPTVNYVDLFNNIIARNTFEVLVNITTSGRRYTYKTTLIVNYFRYAVEEVNITVLVTNNTIYVSVSPPTKCFIVFGSLKDEVLNSSLKLSYYIVKGFSGNEYVYYTPDPFKCSNEWIQLPSPVVEQRQQIDTPEKLPPPLKTLGEDLSSYIVAGITLIPLFIAIYTACRYLTRKALRSFKATFEDPNINES